MRSLKDEVVRMSIEMHQDLEVIRDHLKSFDDSGAGFASAAPVAHMRQSIDRALKVNDALAAMMWSDRPPDHSMVSGKDTAALPVADPADGIASPDSGKEDGAADTQAEEAGIGLGPAMGLVILGAASASLMWSLVFLFR